MNNIYNAQISVKDILSLLANKQDVKDITLDDAYRLFISEQKIRNRPGTVKYYIQTFESMFEYLHAKGINFLSQINKQLINDMICYYKGNNNKAVTINKRLKALKCLIYFCEDNELIDPLNLKIKYLKEELPKIEAVSMDDMAKVLDYSKSLSLNCQVMLLLLLTTGVRSEELVNIECEHIDFNNLTIYLRFTKNGEPRYLPLIEDVITPLKDLINSHKSKWLFPKENNISNHVSVEAIRSLLARTKKALNIEVLSAHKLRHLYATTLLRQGTDIKSVSKLLGHKSIRVTERYLDLTQTEILEKSRINNPLNLLKWWKSDTRTFASPSVVSRHIFGPTNHLFKKKSLVTN